MDNNSLLVTPMSQEIPLTPGETYTGTITVANPSTATNDLSYTVSISPYGVMGANYNIDLYSKTSRTEIIDWIKIDNPSGTLAPNSTIDINFTIKVPQDAAPGGQYAAIKITSNANNTTENSLSIGNIYEIASIIYGNVAGDVVREGSVISQSMPSFIINPIFTSTATIENHGTTHEDAFVTFKITNALNGGVIYAQSDSNKGINEIIMPDTSRELTYTFDNLPVIGVINVSQTIDYNGETYSLDQNIIICPIWFMILIAGIMLSLAGLIIAHVRKTRHKKRASTI